VTLSDVNVIGAHEKGPFSALNVGCVPAIIGGIRVVDCIIDHLPATKRPSVSAAAIEGITSKSAVQSSFLQFDRSKSPAKTN
jgi:hypothetical protein